MRVYVARPCASAAERQAYAAAATAAFRSALQARYGRQQPWRLLEDRSRKQSTSGSDLRFAAEALLLQRAPGRQEQEGSSSMFLCSGDAGVVKCWSQKGSGSSS